MNGANDLRLRQDQQIVVPLKVRFPILEALTAIVRFAQVIPLNHRGHGAVEQEDACGQQLVELRQAGDAGGDIQIGHSRRGKYGGGMGKVYTIAPEDASRSW